MQTDKAIVEEKQPLRSIIKQITVCVIASTSVLSPGMSMNFTSVALPYMMSEGSHLVVNTEQASWIASLYAIGTPVGTLLAGPMVDRWGRKPSMLISNVPSLIGCLLMTVQPNLARFYVGRFLAGVTLGMATFPAIIYTGETVTKHLRSTLTLGFTAMTTISGISLAGLSILVKENWSFLIHAFSVTSVASMLLILAFVPESPAWLLLQERPEEALSSLQRLRGANSPVWVQAEMDRMLEASRMRKAERESRGQSLLSKLARPEAYKPILIATTFMGLMCTSGVIVIVFYAVDIGSKAGVTMDLYVMTLVMATLRLFGILGASYLSSNFGRRPCTMISALGMTLGMSALALQLFLKEAQESFVLLDAPTNPSAGLYDHTASCSLCQAYVSISWLPVVALIIFYTSASLGVLPLCTAMMGEMFPLQVRGVACGLATTLNYFCMFVVVKSYPTMSEVLQGSSLFMLYAAVSAVCLLFIAFCLPETRGKTLEEIERHFAKGK